MNSGASRLRTRAPDRIVAILEHEQLARDVVDRPRQRDRRQTRGLRFLGPIERGSHAPVGRDDVGPAFEQLGGQSRRDRARPLRELRRDVDRGRRITADQRLERAQRLLARERQLQRRSRGTSRRWRELSAASKPSPRPIFSRCSGEHDELLGRRHHLLGEALLQSRLDREEIGLRDHRRDRLPGVFGVGDGRLVSRDGWRHARSARGPRDPAPSRRRCPPPCNPDASPPISPPPRASTLTCGYSVESASSTYSDATCDAGGRHLQIRVVRDRLVDQRVEPGVAEGREPLSRDRAGAPCRRPPSSRARPRRASPADDSPRGLGGDSTHAGRQRDERSHRRDPAPAYAWRQCSFRIR